MAELTGMRAKAIKAAEAKADELNGRQPEIHNITVVAARQIAEAALDVYVQERAAMTLALMSEATNVVRELLNEMADNESTRRIAEAIARGSRSST